jgi:Acetoacetate decarboxylase (ADC)
MIPSSRIRWLNGRYANVDGIPFKMPVRTQTSPALFAAFAIDADQAAGLLPGEELQPLRLFGHGLLVIAVVNYLDTTIGKYVEFCIGVMVTRGTRRAPALPALALRSLYGTGVYIYDLPVSTEISVKGGLGIWGMPKRQANLDYIVGEETVSTQYDLDGQLVVRLDIPRPRRAALPMVMNGVAYGGFRGMLYKSYVHLRGGTGVTLGGREARLLIGDHPRAEPLKHLHIRPAALATGFTPKVDGVLDDHIETWYLTAGAAPATAEVGLRDVVDLSLSEQWLPPPDRGTSDVLMAALSPSERVGPRSKPLADLLLSLRANVS